MDPPAVDAAILDRITPGMTPAEVREAVGSAPLPIPQDPNTPWTLRYEVEVDLLPYILWVHFVDGRVTDRGLAEIRIVE